MKYRRNDPCFCGSGKKYKRCHGSISYLAFAELESKRHEAREFIRQQQQGRGKAIISADFSDHKLVAVGRKLMYSKAWKTFPDFLIAYLVMTFGREWFAEKSCGIGNDRHILLDWLDALNKQRKQGVETEDGIIQTSVTGLSSCVLCLSYGLYLLEHNVELQTRLVHRLKTCDEFQGAYYEVLISSILLKCGYVLQLEDETGRGSQHCEFTATNQTTGKKYHVECKARAVAGVFGKTPASGCSPTQVPTSKIIKHLTGALRKPSLGEKLIFIDINAPMSQTTVDDVRALGGSISSALDRYAFNAKPEGSHYIFITNLPFHWSMDEAPRVMVIPYGINKPDFNISGVYSLREMYRRENEHKDAFEIANQFQQITSIPTTFDGGLISERNKQSNRVFIGETYDFGTTIPGGFGLVTSACVDEINKCVVIAVSAPDGRHYLLENPMTNEEVNDYVLHADAYFGEVRPVSRSGISSAYEMFKWLMSAYKDTPRETILKWMSHSGDYGHLSDDELREIYCEGMAATIGRSKI